jgi:hypothetical protein
MGGLFLDSIIRSIVRNVRKKRRVDDALSWPIAVGKISMSRLGKNLDGHVSPDLVFSYEINGETFYGSAGGTAIEAKQINRVTDAINGIEVIHVRYDPSDPASGCLLNQDNPEIPFEIDHTPY